MQLCGIYQIDQGLWHLCCSIRAYIGATKAKTVLEPVFLDANEPWEKWAGLPQSSCDIIIAINLLQYSPFTTAEVGSQYWFITFLYLKVYLYLKVLKIYEVFLYIADV